AFNMTFIESSSSGWTVWTLGGQSKGYLLLNDGLFKRYGGTATNFRSGGIHIERNTIINNCRFIDIPSGSFNIYSYSPGDVLYNDNYSIILYFFFDIIIINLYTDLFD